MTTKTITAPGRPTGASPTGRTADMTATNDGLAADARPVTPTDANVAYRVWNENALVCLHPNGWCDVLGASIIRGGPNWINGPFRPNPEDMRPATLADFDAYRVRPEGHVKEAVAEIIDDMLAQLA